MTRGNNRLSEQINQSVQDFMASLPVDEHATVVHSFEKTARIKCRGRCCQRSGHTARLQSVKCDGRNPDTGRERSDRI
jgi:hypothetical protein